jgi:hypothetical protein
MHKRARILKSPRSDKKIQATLNVFAKRTHITLSDIYLQHPKWVFHRMDWNFSLKELEARTCDSGNQLSSGIKVECCLHLLAERLKGFEPLTWGEITNGDRTGSHFISLEDLRKKNRALYDKFSQIVINEGIDEPFSLRIGGDDRLWGIVLSDGTFEAVCYDPHHLGWPLDK